MKSRVENEFLVKIEEIVSYIFFFIRPLKIWSINEIVHALLGHV